jgi:hypothetical protein
MEEQMSKALHIAHGAFGRVALLDMDYSLVRHAHPHCRVLLKVAGADTQFIVGDAIYPLTNGSAVLVNGWEPHSYVHVLGRPRTVILALYRTRVAADLQAGMGDERRTGLLQPTDGRNIAADTQPRHESGRRHDGPAGLPDGL